MVSVLGEKVFWPGFETDTFFYNRPLAITPGGVVLSYRKVDGSPQLITTTDWGTGPSTNIADTCDLSLETNFNGFKAALTNAGDLFFATEKRWKDENNKTVYRRGICKGCDFVPIVLDEIEYHILGYDNIDISALSVTRNGEVLVFCAFDFDDGQYRLYVMDLPGGNPRAIFTSYNFIKSIRLSSTGDKILFSYTPNELDSDVPCVISLNGSNMIELSTPSIGDTLISPREAAISPDGNWIAFPKSIPDGTFFKRGVAFIRSDGSEYHFVHCIDFSSSPLSFLANGNSVIFCRQLTHYNKEEEKTYYLNDLFLVDVDKDQPNVRNITRTPEIDERAPVVLLQ